MAPQTQSTRRTVEECYAEFARLALGKTPMRDLRDVALRHRDELERFEDLLDHIDDHCCELLAQLLDDDAGFDPGRINGFIDAWSVFRGEESRVVTRNRFWTCRFVQLDDEDLTDSALGRLLDQCLAVSDVDGLMALRAQMRCMEGISD